MRHLLLISLVALGPRAAAAEGDPVAAVDGAIARWEKSCAEPTELGACTHTRSVAVKHHCEPSVTAIAVRRKARSARSAQRSLMAALDAVEKDASGPAVAAAARGRSVAAEAAFEHFLLLEFPSRLDFTGRRGTDSKKRFARFVDEGHNRLAAALAAYRLVSQHPGATAELRLRAMARTGQIHARLADLLRTAEIPRDVRSGELAADKIAAYCDAIDEVAEPMLEQAREAFEQCAALTGNQGEWAAVCAAP